MSETCVEAQFPDPGVGLRAEWLRGTYGLNWKPARTENGKSETEGLSIVPFLEQIQGLKTVDYIQVHLNESATYSTVHLGPHGLIEYLWRGDMSGGEPINLAVPRAAIGRDPLMDIMQDVKAAGLKVMVYANSGNMLTTTEAVPDVSDRFKEWCNTDPGAQAFINSKSYHDDPAWPNRKYMFCYAEFIIKEYAIRYGDLIDAWLWDTGRTMWQEGGDFDASAEVSEDIEDQRIYQAFADACHAGNPDAATAFNNSPGANDFVNNPFTAATLFDDYMFGHPYSGGNDVGSVPQNFWALEWIAERDGYVFRNDPDNDRTWDDNVVGHWDPPMGTGQWNTGSEPGVADSIFADYYGTAILGNGAVSFGIPLVGRYNFWEGQLICRDWGMLQLEMLDSFLLAEQYAGAPVWARQETYLPPAYLGQAFSRILAEGVDFWDPEGDEITDVLIMAADSPPSWLSISETKPGTWTLSGTPDETRYTEYEFRLQIKDASGETDRLVKMKVFDPDSIAVTGIMISPSRASLLVEDTQLLTALVFPSDASEKSVSWSSNDTICAIVNSSGLVIARDTGSAIITATTMDGDYTYECVITVMAITPVTGVVVSPDSISLTTFGEKISLNVTVLPSNATNQSISWSSNNTSVATVNSSGVVMANGAGSATITATSEDGGYTDECIVTVTSEVAPNLALTGTATQSSTGFSGEPSRAIDGNTDGTYTNGSVTHTNAEENPWWEVDLGAEYSIADIYIFGRTDDCCKGRLSNFTVFVYNSGGTEVYSETFTSYPNPSVTSNTGGISGQRVRIVLNGSTYALSLAEVQVFAVIPVDRLVVTPESVSLTVGDTILLSAMIHPFNASNQSVRWNSNDTSVVSVNSNGVIMAIDAGTVTITATSSDGGYTDECVARVTDDLTNHKILQEEMADNSLLLFPNPVNSILNFDFQNIEGAESITIYSVLGQELFMQEIESSKGYIDISGLESGVYIMKIHGKTTVVTRLIKE